MRKIFGFIKRPILALCIFTTGVAGFVVWLLYDSGPLFGSPKFFFQFIVLAVLDESSYYDGVIWRQNGRVRVGVENVSDTHVLDQLDNYLVTLEKYSGLEIQRVARDEPANVVILHKTGEELSRTVQSFGLKKEKSPIWAARSCFGIEGENSMGTPMVLIGVAVELPETEQTACRQKQMARALGLIGDRFWLLPFVFDSVFLSGELALADKYVLRTLYDNRIDSGMTRELLHKTSWKIVNELFSEVAKSGENALLHPNYVARAIR